MAAKQARALARLALGLGDRGSIKQELQKPLETVEAEFLGRLEVRGARTLRPDQPCPCPTCFHPFFSPCARPQAGESYEDLDSEVKKKRAGKVRPKLQQPAQGHAATIPWHPCSS